MSYQMSGLLKDFSEEEATEMICEIGDEREREGGRGEVLQPWQKEARYMRLHHHSTGLLGKHQTSSGAI